MPASMNTSLPPLQRPSQLYTFITPNSKIRDRVYSDLVLFLWTKLLVTGNESGNVNGWASRSITHNDVNPTLDIKIRHRFSSPEAIVPLIFQVLIVGNVELTLVPDLYIKQIIPRLIRIFYPNVLSAPVNLVEIVGRYRTRSRILGTMKFTLGG